ncbi:MAG: hypothetical protein H6550_12635 [Chitinophagales bacterium]|nr:hypothetical protein [Chitinophagales bacterium]
MLNLNKCLLLLLITMTFVGCNVDNIEITLNDKINQDVRSEIDELTKKIINSLQSDNWAGISKFSSTSLKGNISSGEGKFEDRLFENYGAIFKMLEAHVTHGKPGMPVQFKEAINSFGYTYYLRPQSQNTYVCLMTIPDKSGKGRVLVSMVFEATNNGNWELNIFNLEYILFKGMLGPDIFKLANAKLNEDSLMQAYLYMQAGKILLDPSNGALMYDVIPDFNDFMQIVTKRMEAKYTLPKQVMASPNNTSIVGLKATISQGNIYPVVSCITDIPITNSGLLEQENDLLNEEIEKLFPGLTCLSDSVFYVWANDTNSKKVRHIHKYKPSLIGE